MKNKFFPIAKALQNVIFLPSPASISFFWGFGSLLGACLILQLSTGVFLAMHFVGDISLAFSQVSHICRDVSWGWFIRMLHANGASFFFICLYLHVARGIYYSSYSFKYTWFIGTILLLIIMAAAFLGYVLPWGQMSFWGATVITNLFSAIPFLGSNIVTWLWGGFAVDNATLTRFFAFHFLVPFIAVGLSGVHLAFLHQSGSNNPLGLSLNIDKIMFHPYFSYKDLLGLLLFLSLLLMLVLTSPWALGDPENFIPANPLVTPPHIQPEWYFLFAYAILRSIPNKLGGVIALAGAVLILLILPMPRPSKFRGNSFYPVSKMLFWAFVCLVLLLTWIGARPVEAPFILMGQKLTLIYFLYFFTIAPVKGTWDYLLN